MRDVDRHACGGRRPGIFHLSALALVCSAKRSPALGGKCCPTAPLSCLKLGDACPEPVEAAPQPSPALSASRDPNADDKSHTGPPRRIVKNLSSPSAQILRRRP